MKQFFYESIDSTNLQAKRLIQQGQQDFCVLAKQQTAGRGSRGRSFLSEEGGLYLSVVLPMKKLETAPTLIGAAAAAEAVSRFCGQEVGCKWVNDLILCGKKIGGVLAEIFGQFIIMGIGVNLNQQQFPVELEHVSSLKLLCGNSFVEEDMLQLILEQLLEFWQDEAAAFASYSKRLLSLQRPIFVHREGESQAAVALKLERSGALYVRYEDSDEVALLHSGQVSLRAEDGYL